MEDCNPVHIFFSTVPLTIDTYGEIFLEDWEYTTVVGILIFLAKSSRPDITYAVHQFAQFTHAPRKYHVVVSKESLDTYKEQKTRD